MYKPAHPKMSEEKREYHREYMRKWRAKNPEHVRDYRKDYYKKWYERRKARDPNYLEHMASLLRKNLLNRTITRFGLTRETYDALAAKGCAICAGPPNGRKPARYHFDHDHATGRFCGLLWYYCNQMNGHFIVDPE